MSDNFFPLRFSVDLRSDNVGWTWLDSRSGEKHSTTSCDHISLFISSFLAKYRLRKVVFTWSLAIVTMLLVYETWTFILFVDFVCLFVFYSYHFFMVTWEIYTPEESALWSLSSRLDALAFINSQDVTSLHKSCTRIWTFIKITSDSKLSFFNTFSQIKDFHWNKAALVQWLITCRKTNWRKPYQ